MDIKVGNNDDSNSAEDIESITPSGESGGISPDESDSSLEALVSDQQSIARDRLREKLGREPTTEEADEWLSEHTESY